MRNRSPAERECRAPESPAAAEELPRRWSLGLWHGPRQRCPAPQEQHRARGTAAPASRGAPDEPRGDRAAAEDTDPADHPTQPSSRARNWTARLLPGHVPLAELVGRKPKPLWWAAPPIDVTPEESARTEQLVADLRGGDPPAGNPTAPLRTRLVLGSLCTALLLGATTASAVLTCESGARSTAAPPGGKPVRGELALGPQLLSAPSDPQAVVTRQGDPRDVVTRPVDFPVRVRPWGGANPAAGTARSAEDAVRAFYLGLARSPQEAMGRIAPELLNSSHPQAWEPALVVHPPRLRAAGPHLVLAEVEVGCADGSRLVLRHRVTVTGDAHPMIVEVDLVAAQHFPR